MKSGSSFHDCLLFLLLDVILDFQENSQERQLGTHTCSNPTTDHPDSRFLGIPHSLPFEFRNSLT